MAARVEQGWAAQPAQARTAVSAYLALLSEARNDAGRPLLGVDVQLWLREVRRLTRRLDVAPRFLWQDAGAADAGQALAALYCRHCGRSGWGVTAKAAAGHDIAPQVVWRASFTDSEARRAWMFAPGEGAADDPRVQWADSDTGELSTKRSPQHSEVPVIVTPDKEAGAKDRCPLCGLDDGIRFLGSSVATLASAALGHVFASPDVEPAQKKTLVFTDSVQDASHRAAFIESRAYALNRRSLLLRAIGEDGCTLDDVGTSVVDDAGSAAERFAVLPPDLKDHASFRRYWHDERPDTKTRERVVRLMDFGASLEFGLSSRVGRTLELTGAATAEVVVESLADVVAHALTVVDSFDVQLALSDAAVAGTTAWARGVLERIRAQGGIDHPWLTKFLRSGGDRYSIWGGRPRREGMPAFPAGRSAPSFPTTARASEAFDTITGAKGWYALWTARALGVPSVDASRYVRALLDAFAAAGVLHAVQGDNDVRVWCLPPARLRLERTTGSRPPALRCTVCSTVVPAATVILAELASAPCMRISCPGRYDVVELEADYYRELYRAGQVRRIVAREHTSLLRPEVRVALEKQFKQSAQQASDPNVLTCTPTLELGIDIGDLSMVALTSLPRSTASYLQRVGRAGRLTGSSLVLSLLPARPLELQRLVDPLTMIAGDVVPPACYLDAVEILRRQYLASLVDRRARSEQARPMRTAVEVFSEGLTATSWLGVLVADARVHAETYVTEFLAGFGSLVSDETAAELRVWAGAVGDPVVPEFERAIEQACTSWGDELADLQQRRAALAAEIALMDDAPSLDDTQERDLKRVKGEARAMGRLLSERRSEYWIKALEDLSLLPNYALLDDKTRLDVTLWWTDEETGAAEQSDDTYVRGSRTALHELAPGATFYVGGVSVEIDGLDLGSSRNPATEWRRFCPSCGWSDTADVAIVACPRCQDPAAADTGQVLKVLPFRKASAYASREAAQRDDDLDERRRTQFTIVTTVDADPAAVRSAWGLQNYQFGAEVLFRADIRWINLGPSSRRGAVSRIAGSDFTAAHFESCISCGVVWTAQRGVHSATEARHRGWCGQRRVARPDGWTKVVLSHHLRTQAVRLLVPPVVWVDDTLLTSFRAALLLGLREVLGGDPDHLDVISAVDPAPGSIDRRAMVIHDKVAGGTGYLARFADPEQVRALLQRALDVVASCPCRDDPVAACHRCLLPYVPSADASFARRDRAAELLAEILHDWSPEPIEFLGSIVVEAHDTPIERRFRQQIIRWAKARGATVSAHASGVGDRVDLLFPAASGGQRWRAEPQFSYGFVRPDFVFSVPDPEIADVAVFCDGVKFHASAEHNRIADDGIKRQELREQGVVVFAVTHADLDAFDCVLDAKPMPAPAWAGSGVDDTARGFGMQLCGPGDVSVAAVLTDPMSLLTSFLLRSGPAEWSSAARSVALAFASSLAPSVITSTSEALPALVRSRMSGEQLATPVGSDQLFFGETPGGSSVGLHVAATTDVRAILAIDDRDEVLGTDAHVRAWRDWLALGNVLQFLGSGSVQVTTLSCLPTDPSAPAPAHIPSVWQEIVAAFDGEVAQMLLRIAPTGVGVPEAGLEVADGEYTIDLAWHGPRVAVVVEIDHERDDWLTAHQWTVVSANEVAVRAALGLPEMSG